MPYPASAAAFNISDTARAVEWAFVITSGSLDPDAKSPHAATPSSGEMSTMAGSGAEPSSPLCLSPGYSALPHLRSHQMMHLNSI